MTRLMQAVLPDCKIAKGMSLRRNNIPAIIENVISKYIMLETTQVLQGKYFSVLIHEIIDAGAKILCFLIRYVHGEEVYTDLLDLIRITECSAEDLYKCFLYSLKKHNLSLNNIIGVSIDNPTVMLGRQNAFISYLLKDNEEMSVFPWICYSLYFVACDASSYLPLDVRALLDLVYEYNSVSLKEVVYYMIGFMEVARPNTLHLSEDIRWLAVPEIVEKILNQWTVLLAAFEEAATGEKSERAKPIFQKFNCPYIKAY